MVTVGIFLSPQEDDYPSVLIALFVEVPSPFIAEYFQAVTALNYPKNKIHIFIHNAVSSKNMRLFISMLSTEKQLS